MTEAANRKTAASNGTRRRKAAKNAYVMNMFTDDGAFEFTATVTIEGRTARSSALVADMRPADAIWPEAQRREWIEQLLAMTGLDGGSGFTGRMGGAYLTLLTGMMEYCDARNGERVRSMPKPGLKVVGGYDRKPVRRPTST